MADQATVNRLNGAGAGQFRGPDAPDLSASGVVNNVANLGENLLTLAELQTRLTTIELRQNLDSVKNGGALIAVGSVLGISSLPVLMIAVAELLVSEAGMKRGYALMLTALATITIAVVCAAIARNRFLRSPLGFPLAGEEFARNMNWLRTILRHSGRSPFQR